MLVQVQRETIRKTLGISDARGGGAPFASGTYQEDYRSSRIGGGKAGRAPVVSTGAGVKETVVGAVPVGDTIILVLAGVRVHDVAQHIQTVLVRFVDERLELVGRPAAAAGGEEVGDVVPERSIVRVLLHARDGCYGVTPSCCSVCLCARMPRI